MTRRDNYKALEPLWLYRSSLVDDEYLEGNGSMKRNKEDSSVAFQRQPRRLKATPIPRRRTRQADIAVSLQPWLNLAAVLPPDQPVPSPEAASDEIKEAVRREVAHHAMKGVLANYSATLSRPRETNYEDIGRRERTEEYYRLFFNVRSAIEFVVQLQVSPERGKSAPPRRPRREQLLHTGLPAPRSLADIAAAAPSIPPEPQRQLYIYRPVTVFVFSKIEFVDDPYWGAFREAMEAADPGRLKRCPVCARVYYAVRKNTGACNEHQSLARVRKARRKAADYNASRRFRRKIGGAGVRGKERKRLVELSEALRGQDKE